MQRGHWNKADKMLFVTAIVFTGALGGYLFFPDNIFAQGMLFCSEAALVGGVADWFAVTALFEKPLGFPWHTAILPRRRDEFMEAAAKLVRREFFSRRELFDLMAQYDWNDLFLRRMESDTVRCEICSSVQRIINNAVQYEDISEKSRDLAAKIRYMILSIPLVNVVKGVTEWLQSDDHDKRMFSGLIAYCREIAEHPDTRKHLEELFEHIQDEHLKNAGLLMNLLAGFASAMNVLDLEDLAACVQREAIRFLNEAEDKDSDLGIKMRAVFYDRLSVLGRDPSAQEMFAAVRGELLRMIPLENLIETGLTGIVKSLRTDLPIPQDSNIRLSMDALIDHEITRWLSLLRSDETAAAALEKLIKDVVYRSALEVQVISAEIVRNVISGMTDKQLNSIVYGKVEPDLLWIRMNGSVVGAVIGLALFLLTAAAKGFA